jgi:PKD repeat protein
LVTVLDDEDPVADAGADITDAVVGTAVEFDGTLSSDAEGAIENWTWYIEELDDSVWGETATYTFDTAGTYTVTLTVMDSFGQTATDSVTVTVTEAAGMSDPPVADAGPDETIEVDDEYTFDGTDSSDDVAVVNWTWEFEYVDDEMVTLYGETPVWTFEETGEYLVELTVTDADGQTDIDTVTITVEDPEEPPEDEPTFIEQYGLAIGAVIAIAAIAAIAMLLMRKRKGGKSESGIDGVSTEPEQPSQ